MSILKNCNIGNQENLILIGTVLSASFFEISLHVCLLAYATQTNTVQPVQVAFIRTAMAAKTSWGNIVYASFFIMCDLLM